MKLINNLTYYFCCFIMLALSSCEDQTLPTAINDTNTRDKIRGTWIPVSLAMKFQIGITPNGRDTTIILTPTSVPLVVPSRTNPIFAFTDTLYLATRTAAIDTFWLANRVIRQRGNFSVITNNEVGESATLLRFGTPTYTAGAISRWNYNFVFHGTVSSGANNLPVYAATTYANYSPSIKSVTENQLVLSFTSQVNVGNLPTTIITTANQTAVPSWTNGPVVFTATYSKR